MRQRLLVVGLMVTAVLVVTWALAWPVSLCLGLGAGGLFIGLMLTKPFSCEQQAFDRNLHFISCPACGTKNPRHSNPRYECYHCGRDFSELSGRHPTLPSRIAGV